MIGSAFLLFLGILQAIYMIFSATLNDTASLEMTIILVAFGLSLKDAQ